MQATRQVIGYVLSILLFTNCSGGPSYVAQYGLSYNVEREKLGIPTIPSTWTTQDLGGHIDFYNPNPNQKMPHRLYKRVVVEHGVITMENDTFFSGTNFYYPPEQQNFPQQISIEYHYSHSKDEDPWKIYADLNAAERFKPISIEQAHQILAGWGLWRFSGHPQ